MTISKVICRFERNRGCVGPYGRPDKRLRQVHALQKVLGVVLQNLKHTSINNQRNFRSFKVMFWQQRSHRQT